MAATDHLAPRLRRCLVRANDLYKLGHARTALAVHELLYRALAIDPGYEEAHFNLGCVRAKTDDFDGAAASFRRALELDPAYADAHARLGLLLRDRAAASEDPREHADWAPAAEHLELAIAHDPAHGWAQTWLATMRETEARLDEAATHREAATRLLPDVAIVWSHRGNLLSLRGERDAEAESMLRHAITLDPHDSRPRLWLGRHLWRVKRYTEARDELCAAAQLGNARASRWLRELDAEAARTM